MIARQKYNTMKEQVIDYFNRAGIVLTDKEKENIEITDFGLDDLDNCALQLVVYVNTERVCAKEMVLLPGQICPEHCHPPFGDYPGKEETFRCRYGTVYLYVEGEAAINPAIKPPENGKEYYTVFKEIKLEAGQQFTIPINTKHWFGVGSKGAVISEFSTRSYDEEDVFTDPRIKRLSKISKE